MDIRAIDISASGMRAQRIRMDLIANNLANADTTSAGTEVRRGADGQAYVRHVPYRRRLALFTQGGAAKGNRMFGVTVQKVVEDVSPFRAEQQPDHPHAVPASSGAKDAGFVYFPNVHPIIETVDMMAASRAYEANLAALDSFKSMTASSLRVLG
jgi:flagellar basal-body rod protein FlgC